MCWNQTLTSINIRLKTVNLMNKRASGAVSREGESSRQNTVQRSILYGNSCIEEGETSSQKLI